MCMILDAGVPELVKWAGLKILWLSACAGSNPVSRIKPIWIKKVKRYYLLV